MHEGRTWFIPAFISNYIEGEIPEVDNVLLFAHEDLDKKGEYICVFDNSSACDSFIGELNEGLKDKAICIYAFPSLSDLEKRVRKDFGREIELIVYTSDSPDQLDEDHFHSLDEEEP